MITTCKIDVRYPDCDAMGIVHHAVYPVWYEIARMDFFSKAGFSYTDMNPLGINPAMVDLNLRYGAFVKYPATVTVQTSCDLCEGKKYRLRYAVFVDGRPAPVASATSFHIWTGPDMKALDLSTLPEIYEKLRAAVSKTGVLILAGGASKRMGRDKAAVTLGGKTLLARAAAFWQAQLPGAPVSVAIGRDGHLPELPDGTAAVLDRFPGCGPMAGLHAAFLSTDADFLWVSAVDMPKLAGGAVAALREKATGAEDAVVFQKDGRPEPLFGIYSRNCLPVMEQLLADGDYKMSHLLGRVRAAQVPLPASLAPSLSNVNTPQELESIQHQAGL